RTNTPLQALVLLNDVQFVEAARHLAARIMQECSDAQPAKRIERGMLLTTARLPSETELRAFTELYEISLAKFQGDSEAANKLLGFGESKNVDELDPAEHAAWTIVASTLMNLDETLVRN
ncbi:MAG: DUF1553 domain-containing protein, partial [Planctomycetales bacterium]|nr:DUF1553 domain-containing protein [Planctomycetales bacterium]